MQAVPVWAELVLRSIGNVQDLCGFLLLGALQDAHDTTVGAALGVRELLVGGMHLVIFLLIPVVNALTPWQDNYPNLNAANVHRWYLWMYFLARMALYTFSRLGLNPLGQVGMALAFAYVFLRRASSICAGRRSLGPGFADVVSFYFPPIV